MPAMPSLTFDSFTLVLLSGRHLGEDVCVKVLSARPSTFSQRLVAWSTLLKASTRRRGQVRDDGGKGMMDGERWIMYTTKTMHEMH